MAWTPNKQSDEKVNPESFVSKALNNVIDYDFAVATSTDPVVIAEYKDRFVWLVNFAEGVCKGARLIKTNSTCVDFEKLSPIEENFLVSARELYKDRYKNNPGTAAANIERQARGLLEEVVEGVYDAKRNIKRMELEQLVSNKKLDINKVELELARYRFELLIEAAEAKKTIRKEMNQ